MYGLTQAGSLANKLPQKILEAYGFIPTPCTTGLWRHETIPIQFALVVYELGVEYEKKEDVKYLLDALNANYEAVDEYWEGNIFCDINLEWYYN